MLELLAGEPLLAPRIFDGLVAELGDPFADHGVDLGFADWDLPALEPVGPLSIEEFVSELTASLGSEVAHQQVRMVQELDRLRKTAPAVPMAPGRKSKKVKDK